MVVVIALQVSTNDNYKHEDLHADGFQGSHLLGAGVGVLDSEFEGGFSVVED